MRANPPAHESAATSHGRAIPARRPAARPHRSRHGLQWLLELRCLRRHLIPFELSPRTPKLAEDQMHSTRRTPEHTAPGERRAVPHSGRRRGAGRAIRRQPRRGPPPRRRGPWPREGNRDKQQRHGREPGQVMTPAILPPFLPVGCATCGAAAPHVLTGAGVWWRASRHPGRIIRLPGCRAGSQVGYSRHPVHDRCQDCLVGVQ